MRQARVVRAASTFTLLIVLGSASTLSAPFAAAQQPEELATSFSRTMIVVRDLEASKRFYTYALGFTVQRELELTDATTKAQLGIPLSRRARFAVVVPRARLHGKARTTASVGLLQLDAPASTPLSRPTNEVLAIGEHVMALRTNDIATVHARLKELAARIAVPPVTSPDGKQIELVVYDPDGVRIHVDQRPDP
jgi:catechol 2,3-dioxygenase-like lactoylglutathione lyase family enzyme